MSGHSKWSTIKRKKGAIDAKRGQIFTKIIREITIAAKSGSEISSNSRLRMAVDKAKAANMPVKNIENAIAKGSGLLDGQILEEITYEGYGPEGVAIIMEVVTDNKNRTVAEIRNILSKKGGNLGETGSVNWMFEKCGVIIVPPENITEDDLIEIALEAGAEDVSNQGEVFEIRCEISALEEVSNAIKAKNIELESAEISMLPKNTVKLEGEKAQNILNLVEALEEQGDMQNVYANFDIDDEEIEKLAE